MLKLSACTVLSSKAYWHIVPKAIDIPSSHCFYVRLPILVPSPPDNTVTLSLITGRCSWGYVLSTHP